MKVEQRGLEDVYPYDKNPRHNEAAVDAVAKSIKQFGFQQPIVVDKNMVIIVGHTRWLAAHRLGLKKVPVIVADKITSDDAAAYRIADNKTGELADWDWDLLKVELAELAAVDYDLDVLGFEVGELEGLLDLSPPEAPEDFKEVDENIETDYCCPKCNYEWSGSQK